MFLARKEGTSVLGICVRFAPLYYTLKAFLTVKAYGSLGTKKAQLLGQLCIICQIRHIHLNPGCPSENNFLKNPGLYAREGSHLLSACYPGLSYNQLPCGHKKAPKPTPTWIQEGLNIASPLNRFPPGYKKA
jgi:hypothetical protein